MAENTLKMQKLGGWALLRDMNSWELGLSDGAGKILETGGWMFKFIVNLQSNPDLPRIVCDDKRKS